mmetsp:Transcript_4271/g.9363  ORF Transcript_4271/g.9363 Transcript_4271/m.9363 type:complete len:175 (+) Transcript_4271:293-817(+)
MKSDSVVKSSIVINGDVDCIWDVLVDYKKRHEWDTCHETFLVDGQAYRRGAQEYEVCNGKRKKIREIVECEHGTFLEKRLKKAHLPAGFAALSNTVELTYISPTEVKVTRAVCYRTDWLTTITRGLHDRAAIKTGNDKYLHRLKQRVEALWWKANNYYAISDPSISFQVSMILA